jgi:hypothetical protein
VTLANRPCRRSDVPVNGNNFRKCAASRTREVSGAANAEGYFGSNFPHYSCRMARGPHQDYSTESTTHYTA